MGPDMSPGLVLRMGPDMSPGLVLRMGPGISPGLVLRMGPESGHESRSCIKNGSRVQT